MELDGLVGQFESDYHYFYGPSHTPQRNDEEARFIAQALELAPGAEILDVACGYGRVTNRLAAHGYRVTGLDASSVFLQWARTEAAQLSPAPTYVEGDMRALPFTGQFDGAVAWFAGLFYPDDQLEQTFAGIARALRPGGKFLLDLESRDLWLRRWAPDTMLERDGNLMLNRLRFDALSGVAEGVRIIVRDGQTRRMPLRLRLLTLTEADGFLRRAGLSLVRAMDENGQPFGPESGRMMLIARKETASER